MFADIVVDDVRAAAEVLERAGLPATAECLADIQHYMDSHPREERSGGVRPRR